MRQALAPPRAGRTAAAAAATAMTMAHATTGALASRSAADEPQDRPETGAARLTQMQMQPQSARRKEGSVCVAVRIRPLLPKELAASTTQCVQHEGNTVQVALNQKCYTFDHVFPSHAQQTELYEQAMLPLIEPFLQGFNVTVIAYGQTGSGKTYTMGNASPSNRLFLSATPAQQQESESASCADDDGLIPRFLQQIFERVQNDDRAAAGSTRVTVSFLEIYGEEIHDLLDPTRLPRDTPDKLQLRESPSGVWVQGLTEVAVANRVDAMEQMRFGAQRRITGSTEMNEHSSRSHAVYTITLVRRLKREEEEDDPRARTGTASRLRQPKTTRPEATTTGMLTGEETTVVSKLTFVDLAGSERLKKTQAAGNRMREGIQINVGLLALGNVINALGDERHRANPQQFVPYRSSKLTRLLQDALGGNSRTLFIACVSPAEMNAHETLNTLQYANRAKNIQNKAIKNIDSRSRELVALKAFNALLRRELVKARFLPTGTPMDSAQIDLLVERLLQDATVLSYLQKLEMIASNGGEQIAVDEACADLARIVQDSVKTTLATDGSALLTSIPNGSEPLCEPPVLSSTSSVAIMEEKADRPEVGDDMLDRISLPQMHHTTTVIGLALEIEDMQRQLENARISAQIRLTELATAIERRSQCVAVHEQFLEKTASFATTGQGGPERKRQREQARNRLAALRKELNSLQAQQSERAQQLETFCERLSTEIQHKQTHLAQFRQHKTDESEGTTNAIDLLTRVSEIKRRFGVRELLDVARQLEDEELEITASWIDEQGESIAFAPPVVFPRGKHRSLQTDEVFERLRQEVQNAVADEDTQASLLSALRERARVVQQITCRWVENDHQLTEQQFLETHEQQLRECEEHISELSAALRGRNRPTRTLTNVIEGVPTLETAKGVIKRLVEEVYGQKRVYLAYFNEQRAQEDDAPSGKRLKTGEAASENTLQELVAQHEAEKASLSEAKDREVMAALRMVTPFTGGNAESSQHETHMQLLTQECAAKDIALLQMKSQVEETREALASEAAKRAQLEAQVAAMQTLLNESKMREEAFQTMEKLQHLWRELGIDAVDKCKDLSETVSQRFAAELEKLEQHRAKIQEELDRQYEAVKRLEAILDVPEAESIDLWLLQQSTGKTLSERHALVQARCEMREEALLSRVDMRARSLESISALLHALEIRAVEGFRHTRSSIDGAELNANVLHRLAQQFDAWKGSQIQSSRERIADLLVNLTPALVSEASTRDDQRLLNALRLEKAARLAECTDILNELRSLSQLMDFAEHELTAILHSVFEEQAQEETESEPIATHAEGVTKCCLGWVRSTTTGGSSALDLTNVGIDLMQAARDMVKEIYEGRSNALSFAGTTLQMARQRQQQAVENTALAPFFASLASVTHDQDKNAISTGACDRHALLMAKQQLEALSRELQEAVRLLLYETNTELAKYGIDTDEQRVSFLLGSDDTTASTQRTMLEKYLRGGAGNAETTTSSSSDNAASARSTQPSFLHEKDPAIADLGAVFSPDFGTRQLGSMDDTIQDMNALYAIVLAGQNRLKSLEKIMRYYRDLDDLRARFAAFHEAAQTQVDRFKGNSIRFLEEEKFRKSANKKFTSLQRNLKDEVQKWQQNGGPDHGEYDLSILGGNMKSLLEEMLSIDCDLLHLDLGVLAHSRSSQPAPPPAPQAVPANATSTARRTSLTSMPGTPSSVASSVAPNASRMQRSQINRPGTTTSNGATRRMGMTRPN